MLNGERSVINRVTLLCFTSKNVYIGLSTLTYAVKCYVYILMCKQIREEEKKSRIRETLNLLADADSRTNTTFGENTLFLLEVA